MVAALLTGNSRFPGLVLRGAKLLEVAPVAFGLAGFADLAAVMDELVTERNPAVLRDDPHEVLLNLWSRIGFGEREPVGDAQDVGVHDYAFGLAEANAEDDVGGLAGGAGNGD